MKTWMKFLDFPRFIHRNEKSIAKKEKKRAPNRKPS